MRSAIWISGVLLALATEAASFGCGSDQAPVSCEDGACTCRDQRSCNLDCEDVVGCQPSCLNFDDSCNLTCADDCELDCRGGDRETGVCGGSCGANCDASCGAVGSCIVEAGPDSNFTCVNANSCAAELDDGAAANCLNVAGTCAIRCLGACEVFCEFTDACNVECVNDDRRICGPGFFVCGSECPPTM